MPDPGTRFYNTGAPLSMPGQGVGQT
jgi:hypothetical protein